MTRISRISADRHRMLRPRRRDGILMQCPLVALGEQMAPWLAQARAWDRFPGEREVRASLARGQSVRNLFYRPADGLLGVRGFSSSLGTMSPTSRPFRPRTAISPIAGCC